MASQLTIIDGAETVPETQQCPNCGEGLQGEYCQGCGQKKVHRRELSLKHFFINAANEFTDLESNKAVRTFRALLFKPGHLTDEYLAGFHSPKIFSIPSLTRASRRLESGAGPAGLNGKAFSEQDCLFKQFRWPHTPESVQVCLRSCLNRYCSKCYNERVRSASSEAAIWE